MNENKIDIAWNFFTKGEFFNAENILVSLDKVSYKNTSVKELLAYIYANTDRVE
jgi:hypothetical protein